MDLYRLVIILCTSVEAFETVLSSKQTRIWSSYLSNDVLGSKGLR